MITIDNVQEVHKQMPAELQAEIAKVRQARWDLAEQLTRLLARGGLPDTPETRQAVICLSQEAATLPFLARLLALPEEAVQAEVEQLHAGEQAIDQQVEQLAEKLNGSPGDVYAFLNLLEAAEEPAAKPPADRKNVELGKLLTRPQLEQLHRVYQQETQEQRSPNAALVATLRPWDEELQAKAKDVGLDGLDLSYLAYCLEAAFSRPQR